MAECSTDELADNVTPGARWKVSEQIVRQLAGARRGPGGHPLQQFLKLFLRRLCA